MTLVAGTTYCRPGSSESCRISAVGYASHISRRITPTSVVLVCCFLAGAFARVRPWWHLPAGAAGSWASGSPVTPRCVPACCRGPVRAVCRVPAARPGRGLRWAADSSR